MLVQPKELEGILLVDKPRDHTSHDVVARLRGILKMKRVGHAGTLDPMATGLLIILLGKATKASQYLISLDKEYEGTVEFGKVMDVVGFDINKDRDDGDSSCAPIDPGAGPGSDERFSGRSISDASDVFRDQD